MYLKLKNYVYFWQVHHQAERKSDQAVIKRSIKMSINHKITHYEKNNLVLTFIIILFSAVQSFSQVPQYFNYQAVLRNNIGNVIVSQPVNIRLVFMMLLQCTVVFKETHSATTNQFGVVNLKIGNGTQIVGPLSSVPWATGDKFVEVEVDYPVGSGYISVGTQQLLSVPYTLHAKTADSITGTITETDPVYTGSAAANITTGDITKLSNLSGTNSGDQDLSGLATSSSVTTALATKVDKEAGKGYLQMIIQQLNKQNLPVLPRVLK